MSGAVDSKACALSSSVTRMFCATDRADLPWLAGSWKRLACQLGPSGRRCCPGREVMVRVQFISGRAAAVNHRGHLRTTTVWQGRVHLMTPLIIEAPGCQRHFPNCQETWGMLLLQYLHRGSCQARLPPRLTRKGVLAPNFALEPGQASQRPRESCHLAVAPGPNGLGCQSIRL